MPHVGANSCILFAVVHRLTGEKNSYLEEHRALFLKAKDDLEEESDEDDPGGKYQDKPQNVK